MPVAPAVASSLWAGRGGHWFAVDSVAEAIVSTSINGKGNIVIVSSLTSNGFRKIYLIMVRGDVRLKIKKTGSRRRIVINRDGGFRGRLRGIQQRVSHKSTHVSPFVSFSCHRALW